MENIISLEFINSEILTSGKQTRLSAKVLTKKAKIAMDWLRDLYWIKFVPVNKEDVKIFHMCGEIFDEKGSKIQLDDFLKLEGKFYQLWGLSFMNPKKLQDMYYAKEEVNFLEAGNTIDDAINVIDSNFYLEKYFGIIVVPFNLDNYEEVIDKIISETSANKLDYDFHLDTETNLKNLRDISRGVFIFTGNKRPNASLLEASSWCMIMCNSRFNFIKSSSTQLIGGFLETPKIDEI